ncbi:bacteriocin-like protein [Chryseobacterium polytrichastri]|uniref:Bacteriocin-type signal sequence-containing protein n=1 Tax=Chryseobacterium polytrichastri TaxID=1302687 RepID=A0A1M7CPF0_9FLAO|nr:bacteriocin-type signal sequence-containing protein [Chryseobacterium polytrichastri]
MKNLKKLNKAELKSVYGGQPKKYCVYCERLNQTVCSEVPIAQCP